MIDSGVGSTRGSTGYKERNVSVTEEDEAIVLGEDVVEREHKTRYLSLSEEDENVEDANNQDEVNWEHFITRKNAIQRLKRYITM